MTIRTRIAPSPTGDPHVGTAYIALFNRLFAHSQNGQFILRIEDTDQTRSTHAYEEKILNALKWLGLSWDEGPDCGGPYGPYRQSERQSIYQKYAEQLLHNGHAFYCFCTSERLQKMRTEQIQHQQQPCYDGHCLHLLPKEIQEKQQRGLSYVLRMKVPQQGVCKIHDMLRGIIQIDWSQVDMQVLLKADGRPTYHLAHVIDDHLMHITHIIRGEEWINSLPKHQLLYQYFGWEMPHVCHMPLLRNPDKSKLSKRKNPTSINYYRDMGFLPEALINYLGRMGWSMPDEREKFTLSDMQKHFDITRISLGGPIFDQDKLTWLNGCWIRDMLSDEQFYQRLCIRFLNPDFIKRFIPLAKSRVNTLGDFIPTVAFMLCGQISITNASFLPLKLESKIAKELLQLIVWRLDRLSQWEAPNIFNEISSLASLLHLKIGDVMAPIFVAITGGTHSWSVVDSMMWVGRDLTRTRLRYAITVLGGFSKKETKQLEKKFLQLSHTIDHEHSPHNNGG